MVQLLCFVYMYKIQDSVLHVSLIQMLFLVSHLTVFKAYYVQQRYLRNDIKTDSVQSSRNTCKNYLLKSYSQHGNFLNAI